MHLQARGVPLRGGSRRRRTSDSHRTACPASLGGEIEEALDDAVRFDQMAVATDVLDAVGSYVHTVDEATGLPSLGR